MLQPFCSTEPVMLLQRRLFGTSGIRGLVNKQLTPELACRISLIFAHMLGNEGEIAVARDIRNQSELIMHSVISGIVAGGMTVLDLGILPTPALLHFVRDYKLKGGVMVTGSHSLPAITGLLFFKGDGGEIDENDEELMEKNYFLHRFTRMPFNRLGKVQKEDALSYYIHKMSSLNFRGIDSFRVVLDPGNGSMSSVARGIVESYGVRIHAINDTYDPMFKARSPYPRRDNLQSLAREVKNTGSDLGVASDGDGDRAIFSTATGSILWGDITGSLFADKELQKRNGSIVAPINSSRLIEYICAKRNARLISTKVGPPAIVSALREHKDAVFAFEETGKNIWPGFLLYGDYVYSTLMMLSILREGSLEQLTRLYPRFYLEKRMVRCTEEKKMQVMQRIKGMIEQEFEPSEVITLDGIKAYMNDGSWLLIRPSGTEPFIRCYSEAKSRILSVRLARKGLEILKKAIASA